MRIRIEAAGVLRYPMTEAEREKLEARFWELEATIQRIHSMQPVEGDPAELEKACLLEQDVIEGLFGEAYFEERDRSAE